jgi:L-threonylcarbamoyladenylate synthase
MHSAIQTAVRFLSAGQVIAYPTEAMYGLGCDIRHEAALARIIQMKNRPENHGLIVVAANWQQVKALTQPIPDTRYEAIFHSWPGHTTWVFPAADEVSPRITGSHRSIAIRISQHPLIQALCTEFGHPIVSTSANKHHEPAALNYAQVEKSLGKEVDYIMPGEIGQAQHASHIIDALTGKLYRG